jgi:hypothetical protein
MLTLMSPANMNVLDREDTQNCYCLRDEVLDLYLVLLYTLHVP